MAMMVTMGSLQRSVLMKAIIRWMRPKEMPIQDEGRLGIPPTLAAMLVWLALSIWRH